MLEHPEDSIARMTIRNLTKPKLQYSITLEDVTCQNFLPRVGECEEMFA